MGIQSMIFCVLFVCSNYRNYQGVRDAAYNSSDLFLR